MKHSTAVVSLLAIPLTLFATTGMASKYGITEDEGFSGNVVVGLGYVDIENSYLAGNSLIDVDNATITDYLCNFRIARILLLCTKGRLTQLLSSSPNCWRDVGWR